ncbi:SF1B family DNA helicase RecD2 [Lachnotalea sp. AF33-28]|uniref:SF1B family DNA helicase RecD2 n=1 Tax=Lachnotalea sp. AF33-28 TaxID=2292046 RepID=UPI000E50C638|nr:ATP-dependent RecD-like DNA helicase [Lachnotalea sp. AF33-28]RHP36526.1 ATP-dependent RecD-like DNA helicase [Lachnotalea sp. AF33-28]
MEKVEGYVEHIVYRSEETGYTVMEISSSDEEYTLVGTLPFVSEGEYIEARGEFSTHQMYGEQLKVLEYEIKAPEDSVSIERYLSSGAIKGIGPALAARIVGRFKDDTFRIIEEEPERLAEIKGISENKAMEIASLVCEKRDMRSAMMFLQNYGISLNLAAKIYNQYGAEVYSLIKQNPYRMADDIPGVGFKIADEIAVKVGIHTDSDFRIRSGILYTLLQGLSNGHVYLPEEELVRNTSSLLGVELSSIEKYLMDLTIEKKLIVQKEPEGRIVYASKYYYMELNAAKMLHDLNIGYDVPDIELQQRLSRIEAQSDIVLDTHQREAVAEAVKNGLLVITGGPGTGKTTTITTIIRYLEQENMEILLAAPTGRAAKRMTEATGYEARTIHRMLELTAVPDESPESGRFERNEQNPLEADAIIIDEMSMVDLNILYALLKAVPVGTRLILVGDVDQLPSVGPGNVLKDIIESGCFHVVKLEKIFRQATYSDIIVNAHKINQGIPIDPAKRSNDFLFIRRDDPNSIINATITLIKDKLPGYVHAGMHEIQVMTPMRKGILGVERLNSILQEYLNPPADKKREKQVGGTVFREGDKVMQVRNNYQIEWEVRSRYGIPSDRGKGVFNGDMGVVKEINLFSEELTVEFDEHRLVTYSFKELEELELAYAITVHKSQGSEYPAVILPLLSGPRMLMNRNLLYTGVTRAKSCVCIVGSVGAFQEMAANEKEQKRYSGLDRRLKEVEQSGTDSVGGTFSGMGGLFGQ